MNFYFSQAYEDRPHLCIYCHVACGYELESRQGMNLNSRAGQPLGTQPLRPTFPTVLIPVKAPMS